MSHELITVDEHMQLIQLRPEHANRLFELTDLNRDYLGRFLPWLPSVISVDDSKKHIEETIQARVDGRSYTYGVEVDGVIVGDISIRNLNEAGKTPEIGYWMAADYAGKGLMTRAVQSLTEYGLHVVGVEKIIIRADPANVGSNKVAQKAGYTFIEQVNDEENKKMNIWSSSP